jgi:HTH-type transcriptional regulator, competence development regulator
MNELGNYIRDIRGKKSLREAAKEIGISHTYLDTIEKGYDKRSKKPIKPTVETLRLISNTYNVSFKDLMLKAGYISHHDINPNDEVKKSAMNIVSEYPHLQYNSTGKKNSFFSNEEMKNYFDSVEKDFNEDFKFRFLEDDLIQLKNTLKSYRENPNKEYFIDDAVERYLDRFINDLFLRDKLPILENIKPGTRLLEESNIIDYKFLPSPLKNGVVFLYRVPHDDFFERRIRKGDLLVIDGETDTYVNKDIILVIEDDSNLSLKELIVVSSEEVYLSQPNSERIRLTDNYFIAGKVINVIFEPN